MTTLRALAVTVPLLFGSGPLVNIVADWEIVLPDGETNRSRRRICPMMIAMWIAIGFVVGAAVMFAFLAWLFRNAMPTRFLGW